MGIISVLLLIFSLLFIIILLINGRIIKKDIELNGGLTVGKYIAHERFKKGYTNYFSFYINGVKYKGIGLGIKNGSYEKIGKFYKIRYSKKYKGSLEAFFDQEVIDTSEILNSGFTIKDFTENDTTYAREASFKEEISIMIGLK